MIAKLIGLLKFGSGVLVILLLSFALSACGGLSSEPGIVSTSALPTVTPTSAPDAGHPVARVSLARGSDIFDGAQGCQNCHGETGKGNGQVASSFACPLPNFTDVDMARSQTISAWFAITSNGNGGVTDCLMPPWVGVLNEQQRWDVTSYIYSLHYTPDQLAQGKSLWQSNCAACHGATGKGDGPQASQPVQPNFADSAALIGTSDTDLWKAVTNGQAAMPAFKSQLSDDQRWAVVAYARSLAWDPVSGPVVATEEATTTAPDTPLVKLGGKLKLGTPGSTLPANQPLTLRILDLSNNTSKVVQTLQTTAAADGSFSFGDVQRQINRVYVVATTYDGLLQNSAPFLMAPGAGVSVDLSYTVYQVTNDPSAIQVEGAELYISPFSANAMLVQEVMGFHNTSNRVFMNGANSVQVTLPAAAQQITLDPGMAHQFAVGNDTVIHGISPLYPGDANTQPLQVSYLLPFTSQFMMSVQTQYFMESLALHAPVSSGLTPIDAPFVSHDTVQLQDGVYSTYFLQGTVRAGTTLQFAMRSQQEQASQQQGVLGIVLVLAILAILATEIAIWRLNRQRQRGAEPATSAADKVIDAISELDSRFEKGKISRDTYHTERARLKAEATKLLEAEQSGGGHP